MRGYTEGFRSSKSLCDIVWSIYVTNQLNTPSWVSCSTRYQADISPRSILDCFRASRPSSPVSPSGSELEDIRIHHARRRYILHNFLRIKSDGTSSTKNHERAISKNDKRILKGRWIRVLTFCGICQHLPFQRADTIVQNQKTEPITGISSEGYVGKGMVQSKPRRGPPPGEDE